MRAVTFFILFVAFLLPLKIAFAEGGVLYLSPDHGAYAIGKTFDVQVLADTGNVPINAAEADISFDSDAFSVEAVSDTGSILETWPTPLAFSNEKGTIQFSGLTNHNFAGKNGLLITITFKALRNMPGEVRFSSGAILAADGQESNIITSMRSGAFRVQPEEVFPQPATTSPEVLGAATTSIIDARVPQVPIFTEYSTVLQAGERIIMKGTTDPNTKVSVWLQQGSDAAAQNDVVSAADGSFTFISDRGADVGTYQVWAVAKREGMASNASKTITITVDPTSFAAAALFDVSLVSGVLPFAALVFFGGLGAGYLVHRNKMKRILSGSQMN